MKSWRLERCEEVSKDGRKINKEEEEVGINQVETTTTTKVKGKKRKREEVEVEGVEKKKKKKKKRKPVEVKTGDRFNLSDLLFTKDRDFLIKYNHNQPVKAEQLANKFIVLYFASLVVRDTQLRIKEVHLLDVYKELHPKGLLEVVFVAVGDDIPITRNHTTHERRFKKHFSRTPWTAIPFSDSESRKHLGLRFGIDVRENIPSAFVFDPTGVVLQPYGFTRFPFGPDAFPFSDDRIAQLLSEDDAILNKLSLKKLLVSPQRQYLINNENVRVPVHDLNNKVVALYLYEDGRNNELTTKLKEAYEELVLKKKKKFEVVLVYITNSRQTHRTTTEETFWKTFKTMPWLALPFKDPNCVKLQRMFKYPLELDLKIFPDPSLVIIGRHGKFYEPYGADILMNFGCPAYPFTSQRAGELVAEKANKVRLQMFWGPNTVFKQKSWSAEGFSQVHISQLAGKKIIVLFEDDWLYSYPSPMRRLKEMYSQMKGTDDEFEVIQVFHSKRRYSYYDRIADLPWLTHPCFKKNSVAKKVLYSVFPNGIGLLAFDYKGTVVRRASWPIFENDIGFPFYNGDVLKEVLMDLRSQYNWSYSSDDDM